MSKEFTVGKSVIAQVAGVLSLIVGLTAVAAPVLGADAKNGNELWKQKVRVFKAPSVEIAGKKYSVAYVGGSSFFKDYSDGFCKFMGFSESDGISQGAYSEKQVGAIAFLRADGSVYSYRDFGVGNEYTFAGIICKGPSSEKVLSSPEVSTVPNAFPEPNMEIEGKKYSIAYLTSSLGYNFYADGFCVSKGFKSASAVAYRDANLPTGAVVFVSPDGSIREYRDFSAGNEYAFSGIICK